MALVAGVLVGVGVAGVGVGVGVVSVGVGVGAGVVCVGVGAAVVGALAADVGAGVVAVADGAAVAGAFVGGALTGCRGSQDSLIPGAVAAAALPARAAAAPPVAAVSRALPAIKVTALRCPCATRISSYIDRYHYELSHLP